ncbi:MAG: hypothetical protein MHPSP_004123, partial [Paramarteilia canceri]
MSEIEKLVRLDLEFQGFNAKTNSSEYFAKINQTVNSLWVPIEIKTELKSTLIQNIEVKKVKSVNIENNKSCFEKYHLISQHFTDTFFTKFFEKRLKSIECLGGHAYGDYY